MIQVNNDTRLVLDTKASSIRVWVNIFPPFLLPRFSEKVVYSSSKDWYKSVYASLIINEDLIDQIAWFWFDVEEQMLNSQGELP